MKEIRLMLVPSPGQAPQALATVKIVDASPTVLDAWEQVHAKSETVVLEGYTRDPWAWKPGSQWRNCVVESVDGRKKIPGFTKYLKERQKSAYGRFVLGSTTGVWVVSFVQKSNGGNDDRMDCRISLDLTTIPGCTLSLKTPKPQARVPPPKQDAGAPARKRAGVGFLGKLVGAQQKTNNSVLASQKRPAAPVAATGALAASSVASTATSASDNVPTKTARQVLADLRTEMEQKMLDFDISAESELKVHLSLAKYTAGLSEEDYAKVTMEILKYMVYEAAEEVNEEWVAHKEPSEFMDEVTIVVYKEGCAPPEVLEEINKGEMTQEMIAQQRALAIARRKQISAAERKRDQALESGLHSAIAQDDGDEDVAALNATKRDRRTIEDYEREKKKART